MTPIYSEVNINIIFSSDYQKYSVAPLIKEATPKSILLAPYLSEACNLNKN